MQIVGPQVELKHVKRIEGAETADGREITWANPIRFRGVIANLTGAEILAYQKMEVSARYKVLTNYMDITEKDRVERDRVGQDTVEYDVKFADDALLMDKIAVVLLDVKKE